jgi:hypothetical protein
MIVSIATCNDDERIFGVIAVVASNRRAPQATLPLNFYASATLRISSSSAGATDETFVVRIAINSVSHFIDCERSIPRLKSRAFIRRIASRTMRRLPFSFGPSHLAVIVLVDFACMTLLVLISL